MRKLLNQIKNIPLIRQYAGLPRQAYLLICSKMICACGYFVYGYNTLYFSKVMGYSTETIGRVTFLVTLAYIPTVFIAGKLSDKFSRKKTYLITMLLMDAFFTLTGLFTGKPILILFFGLAYLCDYSMSPLYDSILGDVTPEERRQEAFSLSTLLLNVGFTVMPILCGLFFDEHPNWIFYGHALMNFIAFILLAILLKDTTRKEANPEESEERKKLDEAAKQASEALSEVMDSGNALPPQESADEPIFHALKRYPIVFFFSIGCALLYFIYGLYMYMIPLHLEVLFGDQGVSYYSTLCSINGIAIIFLTPFLILFTKKNKPSLNMMIVALMYLFGFGSYMFISKATPYILMAFLWSCGETMYFANTGAFVMGTAPITHRARFQGFVSMVANVGKSFGPLLIGSYLMTHSYEQAWFVISIISAAAAILFFLIFRYERKKEKKLR